MSLFSLEEYPLRGPSPCARKATASDPALLHATVSQTYLTLLDAMALQGTGASIYELAEDRPTDAYVYLGGLFTKQFIDTRDSDWAIGSPEEDGQQAFDGLTRYLEDKRTPDPDIEEIDVVLAVWKRTSLFNRIRGTKCTSEEVIRFRVGPQDLAAY